MRVNKDRRCFQFIYRSRLLMVKVFRDKEVHFQKENRSEYFA